MNIIIDNPFRILGLLSNSSERDLQRQLSRLKAYANVGKCSALDYDFNFLGELKRELQNISDAASKIEQAKSRVHYSLFWYLNHNQFDEIALTHLKDNNHSKAAEVWEKVVRGKEITSKNFSNVLNLSSLRLSLNACNGRFNMDEFVESIRLKNEIITSDLFSKYVSLIAGEAVNINKEIVIKGFIDEVIDLIKPKLEAPNGISLQQFITAFKTLPHEIQLYVTSKFTDRPINSIENQIEKTKRLRDDFPKQADEFGNDLIQNTKQDLQLLKNILPVENIQLQMIVNKLANELIQCSIDYFNELREDDEIDPGETSLKLARYAYTISAPGQIRDRIEENLESIEDWVGEKPKRQKMKALKWEIDEITELLRSFEDEDDFEGISNFLSLSKSNLETISDELGISDAFYLSISSAVVRAAQNKMVELVNELGNSSGNTFYLSRSAQQTAIKNTIKSALEVSFELEEFDMDEDMRDSFETNFDTLKSMARNFGISTISPKEQRLMEIKKAEVKRIQEIKQKKESLEWEVKKAKNYLEDIRKTQFFAAEFASAEEEIREIKKWKLFRTRAKKEEQIKQQEAIIKGILQKGEKEKRKELVAQAALIANLEKKLKDFIKANFEDLNKK